MQAAALHSPSFRSRPAGAAAALVFSLLAAVPVAAQVAVTPPGFEIVRDQQSVEVPPGHGIEVENDFGDVRARFAGDTRQLDVLAVRQLFAKEGPPVEVRIVEAVDKTRIEVGFRDDEGRWIDQRPPGHRRRADVTVFVPPGVSLHARTDAGLIQLRGLRADVRARSRSGELQIRSISGDVDVASESGPVLVALQPEPRSGVQRIRAASGGLQLLLPEIGDYDVRVTGDATLTTDYSLRFPVRAGSNREAQVIVGAGSTPVRVEAEVGEVRIERRLAAELQRVTAEDDQ